MQDKI
jgi:hypothetical protein